MLAAMNSGSGKTVFTCGLLAALKERGLSVQSFKCGPDYIDPMFHSQILGVPSRNLDLFLQGEAGVRQTLGRQTAELALIEGAMGFYDGVKGTDRASAWAVAKATDIPAVLVLRPKGSSLTLAAQIGGLLEFRTPSHIAGLFLTDCSPTLAKSLAPMLEGETGLPVLGHLPHMAEAVLESRHLGLHTAGEIGDLAARIGRAAQVLDEAMDWDRFFALFDRRPGWEAPPLRHGAETVPLAVARDEAFCFTYAETLDALRDAGAELVFFSPLRDEKLPENACGLYLPGGYPELYAAQLAENQSMRDSIKGAVAGRMPTAAECGGFLYLGQSLEGTDGRTWPMAGYLPGEGVKQDRLVRFGYANLSAPSDSLLFEAGEPVPVHEFHYWDSTRNGEDLTASKPLTGRSWTCGFVSDRLYAAFPHLYFAGRPELAERFVRAAKHYRKERSRHE